jgi:hypothetical protein
MPNINSFLFRNTGSPSGAIEEGPFHVGTIARLVQVECIGSMFFGPTTETVSGFRIDNPFVHGIQYGPHGYTPLALYASANDPQWLKLEGVEEATWEAFTDHAITTVDIWGVYKLNFKFRGQLPIGFDTDMYYSLQDVWGSGGTIQVAGQLRVLWY